MKAVPTPVTVVELFVHTTLPVRELENAEEFAQTEIRRELPSAPGYFATQLPTAERPVP